MEDQRRPDPNSTTPVQYGSSSEKNEPVRSRWTPKPEQILILESIFNSGMVNPPKDETVKIRKLLEKFGSVGDANVFYWFQNRRSRSRRRQRQIQASLSLAGDHQQLNNTSHHQAMAAQTLCSGFSSSFGSLSASASCDPVAGSSSSCNIIEDGGGVDHNFFSTSNHQLGLLDFDNNSAVTSILCPSDPSNLHLQSGFITVLINGVPTEVPRGPLDMKAMFGQDLLLIHSSGLPVPFNDYGFSMHSLQHGESYFLVSRST